MLLIVKNKAPYDYVVSTATCLGEALWLARANDKTIGSEKGAHHTERKPTGWSPSVWDGTPVRTYDTVTVHEDWLLVDAKTDEVVKLPTDEVERWRMRHQWECTIAPEGPSETFEERWHRRRHGHKRQAWGAHRSYRTWRHNACSEFEYGSEVEIPVPKLKRDLRWDFPEYRKVSKCWKDQSKRRHQHHRVVEM